MVRCPLFAVATLLTLTPSLGAAPSERVLVSALNGNDAVSFTAENTTHCPAVVRIDLLESANATASRVAPYEFVVQGRQQLELLTLRQQDPSRPWRYRWQYTYWYGAPGVEHDRSCLYAWPFDAGVPRRLSQGPNGSFSHTGAEAFALDFLMPVGTRILAARDGLVGFVSDAYSAGGPDPSLKGKANEVLLVHPDGTLGRYVHLREGGARVYEGQRVKAGELLGESGNTGFSTEPHLHFEVRRARFGADPESLPIRFDDGAGRAIAPVEGNSYPASQPRSGVRGEPRGR
ncbi:MAG: M23 family metallopeptidase [Candidatus Riflebacteria bacterium]|nr:M23 family metallopeptidase [Candidatus Riflebacteria bacterium]